LPVFDNLKCIERKVIEQQHIWKNYSIFIESYDQWNPRCVAIANKRLKRKSRSQYVKEHLP